jgi:hypothetical protein
VEEGSAALGFKGVTGRPRRGRSSGTWSGRRRAGGGGGGAAARGRRIAGGGSPSASAVGNGRGEKRRWGLVATPVEVEMEIEWGFPAVI